MFRLADMIAVSAEHVRKILIGSYCRTPEQVKTAFIDANSDHALVPADPELFKLRQICFVGIDWARKGGEDLLGALEFVLERSTDARLVIARAYQAVQNERVSVLDRISRSEIADIFIVAARCFVCRVEASLQVLRRSRLLPMDRPW